MNPKKIKISYYLQSFYSLILIVGYIALIASNWSEITTCDAGIACIAMFYLPFYLLLPIIGILVEHRYLLNTFKKLKKDKGYSYYRYQSIKFVFSTVLVLGCIELTIIKALTLQNSASYKTQYRFLVFLITFMIVSATSWLLSKNITKNKPFYRRNAKVKAAFVILICLVIFGIWARPSLGGQSDIDLENFMQNFHYRIGSYEPNKIPKDINGFNFTENDKNFIRVHNIQFTNEGFVKYESDIGSLDTAYRIKLCAKYYTNNETQSIEDFSRTIASDVDFHDHHKGNYCYTLNYIVTSEPANSQYN